MTCHVSLKLKPRGITLEHPGKHMPSFWVSYLSSVCCVNGPVFKRNIKNDSPI